MSDLDKKLNERQQRQEEAKRRGSDWQAAEEQARAEAYLRRTGRKEMKP